MTRPKEEFERKKMGILRNPKRMEGKEKNPTEKPRNRIRSASCPAWRKNSMRSGGGLRPEQGEY
jgi:hypothetical protein